jgi:F-type H+-transporting ATPase subunit b
MLQFSGWFFVLLANFLILLWLLNKILYRPLLNVFEERQDSVKRALESAREMEAGKEAALEDLRKGLAEAAAKAKETFEAHKAEGLDGQRELLEKANQEASSISEKAREDLRKEADKARTALRADVEKFSDEIVGKLVGA